MAQLCEYFREVQHREDLDPVLDLIRPWDEGESFRIKLLLVRACMASGFFGSSIPGYAGKHSNQARGNLVANHFADSIGRALPAGYDLVAAAGAGYPDLILITPHCRYPLEMKATSDWNTADTNRRVICSSPLKLRRLILSGDLSGPPAHIMGTVVYDRIHAVIRNVHLNFFKVDQEVKVRLEASTSQNLLSRAGEDACMLSDLMDEIDD